MKRRRRDDDVVLFVLQYRLLGLFSKNRYEWVLGEQAANAYGAVTVPLYDTLGAEAVSFILLQSEMQTVMAGRHEVNTVREGCVLRCLGACRCICRGMWLLPNRLRLQHPFLFLSCAFYQLLTVKRTLAEAGRFLQNVIQFEDVTDAERKAAAEAGLTLLSFAELIEFVRGGGRFHREGQHVCLVSLSPPRAASCAGQEQRRGASPPSSRGHRGVLLHQRHHGRAQGRDAQSRQLCGHRRR